MKFINIITLIITMSILVGCGNAENEKVNAESQNIVESDKSNSEVMSEEILNYFTEVMGYIDFMLPITAHYNPNNYSGKEYIQKTNEMIIMSNSFALSPITTTQIELNEYFLKTKFEVDSMLEWANKYMHGGDKMHLELYQESVDDMLMNLQTMMTYIDTIGK